MILLSLSNDHPTYLSLRGTQRHGNPDEAEHTPPNRRCFRDEIASPRIEYGVAMTKRVHLSVAHRLQG